MKNSGTNPTQSNGNRPFTGQPKTSKSADNKANANNFTCMLVMRMLINSTATSVISKANPNNHYLTMQNEKNAVYLLG